MRKLVFLIALVALSAAMAQEARPIPPAGSWYTKSWTNAGAPTQGERDFVNNPPQVSDITDYLNGEFSTLKWTMYVFNQTMDQGVGNALESSGGCNGYPVQLCGPYDPCNADSCHHELNNQCQEAYRASYGGGGNTFSCTLSSTYDDDNFGEHFCSCICNFQSAQNAEVWAAHICVHNGW